jgi:hypothetical protein
MPTTSHALALSRTFLDRRFIGELQTVEGFQKSFVTQQVEMGLDDGQISPTRQSYDVAGGALKDQRCPEI